MFTSLRWATAVSSSSDCGKAAAIAQPADGEQPAHLAHWDGTYSTAYCEASDSGSDNGEGYWRGAWGEPEDMGGASGGPQEPAPEEQWPPPCHWPCPATADNSPCAATVTVLPGKGRAALATRSLRPGDEIALEKSFAFVIREAYAASACASCCAACDGNSTASCVFCTTECERTATRTIDPAYFRTLPKLAALAQEFSVDVDLLRILLRLVCTPALQAAASARRNGLTKQRPYDPELDGSHAAAHATLSLCTNWAALPGAWELAVGGAVVALNLLLPTNLQLPKEELVGLAASVNSTAYAWRKRPVIWTEFVAKEV